MGPEKSSSGRTALVVLGAALVLFGLYALARQTGLVSAWFPSVDWSELRTGLSLILLGAFVIWLARGGFRSPAAGTRLYRSVDDRWVAGVLGGLGHYFGVDATLLRLAFIVLVLLGAGWPIIGYILMALLVPKEPAAQAASPMTAPMQPPMQPPAAPPPPPAPEPPAAQPPAEGDVPPDQDA